MHKINPRGIIKWAPFNALSAYETQISQLYTKIDQISDDEIGEEARDIINELLLIAYTSNEQIKISIINQDKQLFEYYDYVIDIGNDYIVLENNIEIKFKDIIKVF